MDVPFSSFFFGVMIPPLNSPLIGSVGDGLLRIVGLGLLGMVLLGLIFVGPAEVPERAERSLDF